jgi:ribulose-5-phosphate 4-epimerase/fuculose-1-phosphate aldolase
MIGEGYVKYTADHTEAPAGDWPFWGDLNLARTRLHDLGLLGVYPNGIGYGNLSARTGGNGFLISGTATGAARVLSADGYCLVNSVDIARNRILSSGPIRASSESMTHGAVYLACPEARCVIHIHHRKIFDALLRSSCPSTPASAAYGTPALAYGVMECVNRGKGPEGVIVLAGHEEGLISYGVSVGNALNLIEELYRQFAAG